MAGLGVGMMPPEKLPQGGGMADMEQGEMGWMEPASPEEQKLYQTFVNTALDIIYPKGENSAISPQILADLKGQFDDRVVEMFAQAEPPLSGAPADNVAAATVVLTLMVDGQLGYGAKARESGVQQPAQPSGVQQPAQPAGQGGSSIDYNAVIMSGGIAILEELVEVSQATRIYDFDKDQVEGIFYRAIDLYRVASEAIGAPGFDKEGLTREFSALVEADKAGNLGAVLPGLPGGAPLQSKVA